MRHLPIIAMCSAALVLGAAGAAAAQTSRAPRVRHLPPAEADAGQPLELTVSVDRAWEATLAVRYRPLDATTWQEAVFDRAGETTYAATIPGDAVAPPGLEYFMVSATGPASRADVPAPGAAPEGPAPPGRAGTAGAAGAARPATPGQERTHFASAAAPHRVAVYAAPDEVRRSEHLDRFGGRRAQIRVAGEYVDYGAREIAGKIIPDRYYRIDASVGYRVMRFPLEGIRFGYTHLIGETPRSARGEDGMCTPADTVEGCTRQAGIKGGGWFELSFVLGDGVEADTRGMVMATQNGFNVGGRGELRIGDSLGTHLALGGEHIFDVGSAGFVRLAWGTVPGVPMAATVEVTNFPAPHRDLAVRLVYDVAKPLQNGFRVGARIGYQARDQLIGGVSGGLNASLDF